MDDEKEKSTVSDNAPMPIEHAGEPSAYDSVDELSGGEISHALEATYTGSPSDTVHEYESTYAEDDSMRGGYASVKGKKVAERSNKFVWIVIAVMTVMCLAVGVCSSVLTAHFMRSGSKPAVISTDGAVQQNIAAVVTARKPCIAEVRCGSLAASGIVMKREGKEVTVLTNAHVIAAYVTDRQEALVRFYGEDGYHQNVTVVGYNEHYDVAVLNVECNTDYEVQNLDDPEFFSPDLDYNEGDYVVSIGNAMGMGVACYDGIISRKSELLECKELFGSSNKKTVPVVRTTAVINAGMSGGGVFDMKGRLVGLGTYRLANSAGVGEVGDSSTDVEDTGFATPVSVLYPVYRRILEVGGGGEVPVTFVNAKKTQSSAVGWLGLPFGFNCEYRRGKLTVSSLDSASPASGVCENDVVTRIGDYEVTDDICATVGELLAYNKRGMGAELVIKLARAEDILSYTADGYRYAL